MVRTGFISLGALALVAASHAPLHAQNAGQTVQLAFGYECGDRFMVRNDGNNPVLIEYAVAGSQDKSQLHLNGLQSAEIASAQSGNVELWVNGKVVASEPKGNQPCTASNGVNVAPLNQREQSAQPSDSTYSAAPVVVYAQPPCYYDDCYAYPYGYPYGYYGYSPFLYPSFGIYGRFGGGIRGGGIRGGGIRGGGFRGGGVRGGGARGGRGHR
ncbi:MAG: hypothetical protein ACREN6_06225 [Gemmatimonadaceae bacterium]